jgi:hypothetical protein
MASNYNTVQSTEPTAELTCPGCGHTIRYFDEANSSYYGCPKCYTFFKYEYEGPPEVLRQFQRKYKPKIAIGSKGFIDGSEYTVVGFMRKNEEGETQQWDEYVLYRKNQPYIILVEYAGDWVVVRKSEKSYTVRKLNEYDHMITDNGEQYELHHSYQFYILYACGEFDWNVLGDELMITYEYMSDTRLLVNEVLNDQSDWYWGTDMNARQVSQAFGGDAGDGRNDITGPMDRWSATKRFTIIMVLAVIAFQFLFAFLYPEKTVLSSRYMTAPDTTVVANIKPIITESFNLSQSGGVNIEMKTDVDNEWAELSVTMVNEKTGEEYESTKAIEYYHGYEDGESWSEGDNAGEVSFSRIPAGKYHLNVYPYSETKKYMNIDVTVTQNKNFYSNMWLMLAALLAWPALRSLGKKK